MKLKLSLAAILSTTAIASGVFLSAENSAQACSHKKLDYDQERYERVDSFNTPLSLLVTLPGIAIATALSVGYRRYNRQD